MKVRVSLLQAAMSVTTFFLLTGCEKAFDYLKDHPGENARLCHIQKLEFSWPGGQSTEISINYNADGNPTAMISTGTPSTTEEYHFRYDKYGRLSDFMLTYYGSAGGVVIWHEYSYPDKKTIIDSAYEYTGNLNDPVHPTDFSAHGEGIFIYSLDASGRIIKSTEPSSDSSTPPYVTNFAYDVRGNLVRPGVTYDNKVNVYQTNKVWMFVYNDYSVNNPLAQDFSPIRITGYNAAGLPTALNSSSAYYEGYLFNYVFFSTCK